MLRQVAEGALVHQSEFLQSNAIVVQGRAGVLLVDPGVQDHEMACLANDLSHSGQTVVAGFPNPLVASFYVLSMVALALHLFHGIVSMLQTLGLSHPRYNGIRFIAGAGYAAVVTAGNLSFPLSVYFGLVP